ncbi:MAG: GtrA family protein [Rhizobacter sp.]
MITPTKISPNAARSAPKAWPQLLRFLCVGVVNTLVGLSVIYAFKYFGGLGDLAANACGYAIGLCMSFTLNRRWTFDHRGAIAPAAIRFLVVAVMAYFMNLLTVMLCIHGLGMNSYVAQALGVPPYTLTSFALSRLWAFRTECSK